MMNSAERHVPIATAHADARCTPRGSTFHPKTQTPRNVDSRKNAASPSIASGAPNTSPTNFEYADQSMPNWNSWTRPVTTPTATDSSRNPPKKRVRRRYSSLRVRYHCVCRTATSTLVPIVTGTNRK